MKQPEQTITSTSACPQKGGDDPRLSSSRIPSLLVDALLHSRLLCLPSNGLPTRCCRLILGFPLGTHGGGGGTSRRIWEKGSSVSTAVSHLFDANSLIRLKTGLDPPYLAFVWTVSAPLLRRREGAIQPLSPDGINFPGSLPSVAGECNL